MKGFECVREARITVKGETSRRRKLKEMEGWQYYCVENKSEG